MRNKHKDDTLSRDFNELKRLPRHLHMITMEKQKQIRRFKICRFIVFMRHLPFLYLPYWTSLILCCFLTFPHYAHSEEHSESIPLILQAAENLFIFLNERDYNAAWELMTEKSHQTIINDIYKTSVDRGIDIRKEDISRDIHNNGILFNSYWNAFMTNFDPDVVLNDRVWEIEETGPDHAVILLKKKGITKLQMYKEGDRWKVGLVETFWIGKPLKIIKFVQSLIIR